MYHIGKEGNPRCWLRLSHGTLEIGIILSNYVPGNLKVHMTFSPVFLLGINPKIMSEIRTEIV